MFWLHVQPGFDCRMKRDPAAHCHGIAIMFYVNTVFCCTYVGKAYRKLILFITADFLDLTTWKMRLLRRPAQHSRVLCSQCCSVNATGARRTGMWCSQFGVQEKHVTTFCPMAAGSFPPIAHSLTPLPRSLFSVAGCPSYITEGRDTKRWPPSGSHCRSTHLLCTCLVFLASCLSGRGVLPRVQGPGLHPHPLPPSQRPSLSDLIPPVPH